MKDGCARRVATHDVSVADIERLAYVMNGFVPDEQ